MYLTPQTLLIGDSFENFETIKYICKYYIHMYYTYLFEIVSSIMFRLKVDGDTQSKYGQRKRML